MKFVKIVDHFLSVIPVRSYTFLFLSLSVCYCCSRRVVVVVKLFCVLVVVQHFSMYYTVVVVQHFSMCILKLLYNISICFGYTTFLYVL